MGTGHVMRCLALAQGWQRTGGRALFVQAEVTVGLTERLRREDLEVVRVDAPPGSAADADATVELARQRNAAWVVADGYGFDSAWQKRIKDAGLRLLLWDDYGHAKYYHADLVLNQNVRADAALYAGRDSDTRLLLGTRYVQLRREFLNRRWTPRDAPKRGRHVLVTMGGSDPENVTGKAIQALAGLPNIEAVVVAGSGNPRLTDLQAAVARLPEPARLAVNVSNMAELMVWADVAVSAAGSTCYEMAVLGLPALVLITAENQKVVSCGLHDSGAAINLGWHAGIDAAAINTALVALLDDAGHRSAMAAAGRELVDGYGVKRVMMHLLGRRIWLRATLMSDAAMLWEWANLPDVRAVSFSAEPIPWEEHVAWLGCKLQDTDAMLRVAMTGDDQPVGPVKIEKRASGRCEISISLATEFRGQGLAVEIVRQACEEYLNTHATDAIHAFIKTDNQVSLRLFAKAGFRKMACTTVKGHPAEHWILDREGVPA